MEKVINNLIKAINTYNNNKDTIQVSINTLTRETIKDVDKETLHHHQDIVINNWVLMAQTLNLVKKYLPIIIDNKQYLEDQLADEKYNYSELCREYEIQEAELEKTKEQLTQYKEKVTQLTTESNNHKVKSSLFNFVSRLWTL